MLQVMNNERQKLLIEWNNTSAQFPQGQCLHQLFEATVEQEPEAIAMHFKDQQMTYRELNFRANQLAHYLRRQGVGPEVCVGICMERSPEMVIGLMGILKAGGAYLPLDPGYPMERLAFMLRDTQAQVLLTQRSLLDLPLEHEAVAICLDLNGEILAQESSENPRSEVTSNNLAYVIYTSGSSGRPKGVAIRHHGIVNNVIDINIRFGISSRDRVLALSSLSFDMSVYELLGILTTGGAIVLPEAQKERDANHWSQLILQHKVSLWSSAPSLLKMLIEYVEEHPEPHFAHLRIALLAGDWIPVAMPGQLKAFAPEVEIISLGGATEVSIYSTTHLVDVSDTKRKSIPYGRPMANQQAYVLDNHMQIVPIGAVGELYFGGEGLARGYLNRPDLSAERFIPNPFSSEAGARLYKTGDLVRYQPDGNLELLGRIDQQVKIRGLRIELGEIEMTLKEQLSVKEAVTLVREDHSGNKYLVAYIVPQQGEIFDLAQLKNTLRKSLPIYMVPSFFVLLNVLPLSPNGKIDRNALPAPETEKSEELFVAPRNPIEEVVARIWIDVPGLELTSIHDNLFEHGGTSLQAIQMRSQLRETFLIDLPLHLFFDALTVAKLATLIEQIAREAHVDALKIAQITLQLYQLSEAEIGQMLASKDEQ